MVLGDLKLHLSQEWSVLRKNFIKQTPLKIQFYIDVSVDHLSSAFLNWCYGRKMKSGAKYKEFWRISQGKLKIFPDQSRIEISDFFQSLSLIILHVQCQETL